MAFDVNDLWFAVALSAAPWPIYLISFSIGYILGSIPFGYVLAHFAGVGDIRKVGSGNIGATNVLRTGRRGLAALTLLLDAGKGFIAVLLCARYLGQEAALFAAAGAFLGHLFPVWLRFRGGKGVATYLGVLAGLFWPAAAFFCAVWLGVAILSRMSSLSALVAASLAPVYIYMQGPRPIFWLILALSALLILKHRKNIQNIISGHESKIGDRGV